MNIIGIIVVTSSDALDITAGATEAGHTATDMIWACQLALVFSTLLVTSSGRPSASGWQDNSIPGSSGWQAGSSGWQGTGASLKSDNSGWQTGSSGWQGAGSGLKSDNSGWQGGSSHNFYDSSVSTDYVSRYHGPIALPVVLPDGTLADTPEVAAAKSAHLAALEKAKALWYGPKDDGSYDPHKYEEHEGSSHGGSLHEGSSQGGWNSAELQYDHALKSLHTETHGPQNAPYQGPLATTAVLPSGYLADTPAVEAARAAHLTAVYKADKEAEKWKQGWKQGWD